MKLAVVRLKGVIGLRKGIKDTFKTLNLPQKFACAILEDTPINRGMLIKIKDFSTFGTVDDSILELLKKREEKGKKFYRLHPPIKGFERKGTKKSFNQGGALGDRKDKMVELIKRMV